LSLDGGCGEKKMKMKQIYVLCLVFIGVVSIVRFTPFLFITVYVVQNVALKSEWVFVFLTVGDQFISDLVHLIHLNSITKFLYDYCVFEESVIICYEMLWIGVIAIAIICIKSSVHCWNKRKKV